MAIPFLNSITLGKNQVQDFCVFNYAGDPTPLTSAGDYGYFWLNTTGGMTLKWWDGTNVRSIVDSTNISSFTSGLATDLAGGGAGQVVYQNGSNDTQFLAAGSAGQVLSSNGTSAPSWLNQSSLSVGSATNKTGGNLGDLLVQSGSGSTGFLNVGTAGQVITSNGASPQYVSQSTLSVGSATTATTATNVAGGIAGDLLYQTALATTGKLNIGTAGQVLNVNVGATAPQWVDQSTLSVGSATTATTATTANAVANALTAGTYLTSGGTYNGSVARTFAVDATDANTASKVVARDASGNFAAGTITAAMVTGLNGPSNASDAANKAYVDANIQGLDAKQSVRAATVGNINLSAPPATIDNVTMVQGYRVLVKNQTIVPDNGIYIWDSTTTAMVRSDDCSTYNELVGAFTFVEDKIGGTAPVNANTGWICTAKAGGTLGTNDITWAQFSAAGSYTANRGMVLDGTAFNFAQNSDYAVGDIPYATGGTTIGLLADVATGNALISGGVATAPSWGKIGLTTHVSGTLPVANGGTGGTSFTQGQVVFGGASALTSSSNLFWDNSNNRLGIGTATPTNLLTIGSGSFNAVSSGTSAMWTAGGTVGLVIAADGLVVGSRAGADRLTLDTNGYLYTAANGRIGVGVVPAVPFHVSASDGIIGLINGSTKAIRLNCSATTSTITGTDNTGTGSYQPLTIGGSSLLFDISNTTKLIIDPSGNLGLGVTPSAHSAGRTAFQMPAGVIEGAAGELNILNNAYLAAAGWTKIANGSATMFRSTGAEFKWYQAGAGTGVFTWTQAMTLDASGRLGIECAPTTTLSIGSGAGSGGNGGGVYLNRGASTYNFYEASDGTNNIIFGLDNTITFAKIGSINSYPVSLVTNNTVRVTVKTGGQLNFTGLAADPAGAAGDLYYSTGNYFKWHNGTAWQTFPRKYSTALSSTGTSFTVTHNLGTRDVTVMVRKSGSTYDQVFTDVQMTDTNNVTVIFASSVTGSDYTVTVIG